MPKQNLLFWLRWTLLAPAAIAGWAGVLLGTYFILDSFEPSRLSGIVIYHTGVALSGPAPVLIATILAPVQKTQVAGYAFAISCLFSVLLGQVISLLPVALALGCAGLAAWGLTVFCRTTADHEIPDGKSKS